MELAPFKFEERKGGVRSNCLGAAPFSNITNPIQSRAETNIRNVTNKPFSKRTNIRIFVRFND